MQIPVVKATRARFTRVDSCGMPIAGPGNRAVSSGFITVKLSPQMRDAEDLEQANAEGRICVADRTPPERKWWNVSIEFCNIDTCVWGMFTDWPLVTDYAGKAVGFRDRKDVPATRGVAIEIWTGLGGDSCDVPTDDSILTAATSTLPYGYWLIPAVKEPRISDIELGAKVATFTLEGITVAATRWGKGPYNVVATDIDNTPGRLIDPWAKDQHIHFERTTVEPPPVEDGCCPLVLPSPYYGALAVEVAPNQPPCDFVCSDEVQSVTFSGPTSLEFAGFTTSSLGVASTAPQVQAALEALSSIGAGNVTVTGAAPGPFTVTFVGDLAGMNQPVMTATTPANATITTTTEGGDCTP